MNVSNLGKICMFLSSYLFLFLALGIKSWGTIMFWILFILSILGVMGASAILRTKINPGSKKIATITRKNDQIIGYLATYILPFLGFTMGTIKDLIAVMILFFMISILYIRADLLHINPTLMLLGYNIYEIKFEDGIERILITKNDFQHLLLKDKLEYYEIVDRTLIIEKGIYNEV